VSKIIITVFSKNFVTSKLQKFLLRYRENSYRFGCVYYYDKFAFYSEISVHNFVTKTNQMRNECNNTKQVDFNFAIQALTGNRI